MYRGPRLPGDGGDAFAFGGVANGDGAFVGPFTFGGMLQAVVGPSIAGARSFSTSAGAVADLGCVADPGLGGAASHHHDLVNPSRRMPKLETTQV